MSRFARSSRRRRRRPAALLIGGGLAALASYLARRLRRGDGAGDGGGDGGPVEAGAGPTADSGALPSEPDDGATTAAARESSPQADQQADVEAGAKEDDPLVARETAAAARDAGAIGGQVDTPGGPAPGWGDDPAARPVVEGSGDAYETLVESDADLGADRERPPADRPG